MAFPRHTFSLISGIEIQAGEWHSRKICFSLSAPREASDTGDVCTEDAQSWMMQISPLHPTSLSPHELLGAVETPRATSPALCRHQPPIEPCCPLGSPPLSTALAKLNNNSDCSQELPQLQLDVGGKLNSAHKGIPSLKAARDQIQGKDS